MPAVIDIPFDPVLLRLGPFAVHWYGAFYVLAFAVGIRMTTGLLTRRGYSPKQCSDLYWWNIAMGLLGARLYFVIQQPNLGDYLRNPIQVIAVWNGGMAFFGAIIACVITCAVFAYRNHLSVWAALDAGALFATLPQAIGRLGNIVNGDILGPPSNLPWAVRYTNPHSFAPAGIAYQPAAAYELLASLVIFVIILLVLRLNPPPGTAVLTYLVAYPVSQLLLFYLRSTEPVVAFGLKQAQLTALAVLVVGVPALLLLRRRYPDAFTSRAAEERTPARPVVESGG